MNTDKVIGAVIAFAIITAILGADALVAFMFP